MGFGWTEIILITTVVLLIFGPKRLPELARGIGQSVGELKKGMQDVKDEVDEPMNNLEEATAWSRDSDLSEPTTESARDDTTPTDSQETGEAT